MTTRNQAAAWKLVMDRILPVAAFEKDVVQSNGKSAIQINITGVGAVSEPTAEPTKINHTTIDGDSVKYFKIEEFDCQETGNNEMKPLFLKC